MAQQAQRMRPAQRQCRHADQTVEQLADVGIPHQQAQLHKGAIHKRQENRVMVAERASIPNVAGIAEKLKDLVMRIINVKPRCVQDEIGD